MKGPLKFSSGNEVQTTVGTSASAVIAIPNTEAGVRPKYVRVVHDGGTSNFGIVRVAFGNSTVGITATSGLPIIAAEPEIIDVTGFSHYVLIGTEASIDFTLTPLENF